MTNLEIVQSMYAAFGRGDADTFMSHLHDDVRWEQWDSNEAQRAAVPYLLPRNGKASVPGFLAAAGGLEMHDLRVLSFLANENQVAVEVEIEFTVKATGKRLRDQELHLWTLAGGKVTRLRHYIDTAKHIAANEPAGG